MMCLVWTKHGYRWQEPFNYDLERMEKAVSGALLPMPEVVKREGFRAWMHEQASKIEREKQ